MNDASLTDEAPNLLPSVRGSCPAHHIVAGNTFLRHLIPPREKDCPDDGIEAAVMSVVESKPLLTLIPMQLTAFVGVGRLNILLYFLFIRSSFDPFIHRSFVPFLFVDSIITVLNSAYFTYA